MNSTVMIRVLQVIFLSVVMLCVGFGTGVHYRGIHDQHIWERVESRLNGLHVVRIKPDKTYSVRCEPIGRECQEKDPLIIFEGIESPSAKGIVDIR